MPLPTIVTCFPLTESQAASLSSSVAGKFKLVISSQEEIAENLHQADIFCGHAKVPVDWKAVVEGQRLKWIQSSAAGLDHCLTPEVIDSPILVSGCSGLFAPQVTEQALSLLLGLVRRSNEFFRAQQARQFDRLPTDNLELKRVLILGLGGNGQRIARALQPLAGSVEATDCFPEACQGLVDEGVVQAVHEPESLMQRLPEADVVIITLPLSQANEQSFGEEQLAAMPAGSYLVNVGRGSVVDTQALTAALASQHLAGAGLDVVDPEPLPTDSPLWALENVILSPHVGAQSPRRVPVTLRLFAHNLDRFQRGLPLVNQVDKQLGFPRPELRLDLQRDFLV